MSHPKTLSAGEKTRPHTQHRVKGVYYRYNVQWCNIYRLTSNRRRQRHDRRSATVRTHTQKKKKLWVLKDRYLVKSKKCLHEDICPQRKSSGIANVLSRVSH